MSAGIEIARVLTPVPERCCDESHKTRASRQSRMQLRESIPVESSWKVAVEVEERSTGLLPE